MNWIKIVTVLGLVSTCFLQEVQADEGIPEDVVDTSCKPKPKPSSDDSTSDVVKPTIRAGENAR